MPERVEPKSATTASAADAAVRGHLIEGHRRLRAFLIGRLGDAADADEVLQAFALKALERSWSVRDVATVRGWLGSVLATTLIDHWRQRGATHRRLDEIDADGAMAVPDAEVDGAVCDCLYRVLPTMKPEYAEVIRRIDLLGETRGRLAGELGTTVNNLTVRLHRARRALRLRLEAMCRTCPEHGFFDCRCDEERRRAEMRAAWSERPIETLPGSSELAPDEP